MAKRTEKNKIKDFMESQGRKSSWLSEQLGVSRATVYKYMSNDLQPSIFRLKRVAEVLGVKMEDLV